MKIYKLVVLPLLAIFALSSCALLPPSHEERIEQFRKTCESIGFKPESDEYSNCILELEKSYLQGSSSKQTGMSFMCKEAVASGDAGAIRVHCN